MTSETTNREKALPNSVTSLAELGALFDAERARLERIAKHRMGAFLGTRLESSDVVHSVYVTAQRRWAAYRADPKVSPFLFLYRLLSDHIIEEWRKANRRGALAPIAVNPSEELVRDIVASDTSPSKAAARNEERELVRRALATLDDKDGELIRLRGDEALSFKEIGEVLGASENTVAVRYARALKRLREAWRQLTGESRP